MTNDTIFDEGFAVMFSEKPKKEEKRKLTGKTIEDHILKNQSEYDQMQHAAGSVEDIMDRAAMVSHVVSHVVNNWGIDNLVGIQPLPGPIGLCYSLQYTTVEPTPGVESEDDHFSMDPPGNPAKRMSLDVVSIAMEAGSRNLTAKYSNEAAQDMKSMYGLDIKDELQLVLGDEIAKEISAEVIGDLVEVSHKDTNARYFEGEDSTLLSIAVNLMRNEIARTSRRGAGNWIVVGTNMLALLIDNPEFERATKENNDLDSSALRFAGHFNGIKVFHSNVVDSNQILCGYKGGTGEVDTGYIYAPYVVAMCKGLVMDPVTFSDSVCFMTRYAKQSLHKVESLTTRDDDDIKNVISRHLPNDYYRTTTFTKVSETVNPESRKKVSELFRMIDLNVPVEEPEAETGPTARELMSAAIDDSFKEARVMTEAGVFISRMIAKGKISEFEYNSESTDLSSALKSSYEFSNNTLIAIDKFIYEQLEPYIVENK